MPISHVVVLGAGISGLSAAIALSKASTPTHPLRITVVELRKQVHTIGGAVNLTPAALRSLERLGAAGRVRARSHPVQAIDLYALRTGRPLGSVLEGEGAVRGRRHDIVESLLETVVEEHGENVTLRWGMRVVAIRETGDLTDGSVVLEFEGGETITADILLGCDGIHSSARRLYVHPESQLSFTGRVVAMGFADVSPGDAGVKTASGAPAVRSSCLVQGQQGSLIISFYEPSSSKVFLGAVMARREPDGDAKEGWRLAGDDRDALRRDVLGRWKGGEMTGLEDLVERCEEWNLYPVYMLPTGGPWSKGRVLLIADAAHAMPPQGESTGYAMEDAVLLAHVLSRRATRGIDKLFADYETLRRPTIEGYYKESVFRWNMGNSDSSWLRAYATEWFTWAYLRMAGSRSKEHFAADVSALELPE